MTAPYSGNGRPPVPKYPDPPRSVKELVIAAGRKAARPVQWRKGCRPVPGAPASSACTPGSGPCGSGPPDAGSARPPTARNCPSAGFRPSDPPPRPSGSSSGCPTCPVIPRACRR
ncbi:transposase [Streptomyces griseoluteus]|uniref:transposase n=1 Tax=Streptomyces griseoluteus TaxID=29306 RepID=UPI00370306FB